MTQKVLVSLPAKVAPSLQPRRHSFKVAQNLLVSFRYAWSGVQYTFMTQRNFRIHLFIGMIALSLGVALRLPGVELAVIAVTVALVMTMELLNTAVEAVVDLSVGKTYHDLAKVAKDCAAGAVLTTAIASLLVAIFLLLPPLTTALLNYLLYP